MTAWDDFRIEFDPDGTLRIRGRDGWREAVCGECGEPIRWVLDIFSFKTLDEGSHALGHARCLWTPEGIAEQAKQAEGGVVSGLSKDARSGSARKETS